MHSDVVGRGIAAQHGQESVAGRVVKWQGKLVGVDLGRLRRMIDKSRDRVLARAGYAPDLFGTCCRA